MAWNMNDCGLHLSFTTTEQTKSYQGFRINRGVATSTDTGLLESSRLHLRDDAQSVGREQQVTSATLTAVTSPVLPFQLICIQPTCSIVQLRFTIPPSVKSNSLWMMCTNQ